MPLRFGPAAYTICLIFKTSSLLGLLFPIKLGLNIYNGLTIQSKRKALRNLFFWGGGDHPKGLALEGHPTELATNNMHRGCESDHFRALIERRLSVAHLGS